MSAAAYMKLSPYILKYALTGLKVDADTGVDNPSKPGVC